MSELKQAKGNSYYFGGKLSVGVYLDEQTKTAILIDSSLDKDTARKIDNAILSLGYRPSAIINTHSHADHIGGNHHFQQKHPEISIYASPFEAHLIEAPFLEPLYLAAGSLPFKELRNKFLEAKPSKVTDVIPFADHVLTINGVDFQIVTLPGHSFAMFGVLSPDGVFYVSDAVFGEETIEKHGVLFYTDIGLAIESLEKVKNTKADAYVLYHGGACADISSLIDRHLQTFQQTSQFLLDFIREHAPTVEAIVQKTMEAFQVPDNVAQHALTTAVVRSYLTKLQQEELIAVTVENGLLRIKSN